MSGFLKSAELTASRLRTATDAFAVVKNPLSRVHFFVTSNDRIAFAVASWMREPARPRPQSIRTRFVTSSSCTGPSISTI